MTTVKPKRRRGLRVTLICDRMKSLEGRKFVDEFPAMAGWQLSFVSWRDTGLGPEVWTWLTRNRYL